MVVRAGVLFGYNSVFIFYHTWRFFIRKFCHYIFLKACTDNTCQYSDNGSCSDGGSGSDYSSCEYGTDCNDCCAKNPDRPECNVDANKRNSFTMARTNYIDKYFFRSFKNEICNRGAKFHFGTTVAKF